VSRPGTVVVIGAGQAGFQAAASLREEAFEGRVVLLGDEPDLPYQRPPLSKAYLTGKADAGLVRLRPERFYAENRVELRAGERAGAIDRAAHQVVLASGERLPYDHLIIATGARNRALPITGGALDGVFQLRTLAEAEALRRRLEGVRYAVVVGAGFIGLEFAAVVAGRGLEVTVVEAAGRVMSRAVSKPVSDCFRAAYERLGVRFVLGAAVVAILGADGRVTGVTTADGRRFPADLVLVGIGVLPNTDLAAEAGLAVADGVAVDERLLTCDPAISAIGDCAAFPCRHAGGGAVRLESVQNAVDQARCVAARLADRPTPYVSLPWFWSDQGPLKLQIAGLAAPHEQAVLRGDPAQGSFSVFCFQGGRLTGVESVNRPLDHILARRLLAGGASLTPEQVAHRSFDLKGHADGLRARSGQEA
jgi:3-phenylpropionate/trans-cinnamate dioxygenase ferredoxin reductase subunit